MRDQCWLNETLKTVHWIEESSITDIEESEQASDVAIGDELDALLSGEYLAKSRKVIS